MMGRRPNDAIQILISEFNLPLTIDEYKGESNKMYEDIFPRAKLLPGNGNQRTKFLECAFSIVDKY